MKVSKIMTAWSICVINGRVCVLQTKETLDWNYNLKVSCGLCIFLTFGAGRMESDLQNLCQSGFPGLHLLHGDMLERNKFFEGKTTTAGRTSPWPGARRLGRRISWAHVASAGHVAWAITSWRCKRYVNLMHSYLKDVRSAGKRTVRTQLWRISQKKAMALFAAD